MKIELKSPYKSLETLATEELPNLAVLIGRNGAGKTQLLEALRAGNAAVPGIGGDEIALYNMDSFRPPNTERGQRDANHFAKVTADAYLLSQGNGRPLVKVAADVFRRFATDIERDQGVEARENFERTLRDEVGACLTSPCSDPPPKDLHTSTHSIGRLWRPSFHGMPAFETEGQRASMATRRPSSARL